MSKKRVISGLYAITADEPDTTVMLNKARLVLQGGASVLQYRNKSADTGLRLRQARVLRSLTFEYKVILIVNDDPRLALESGADGVHLGGADDEVSLARDLLGENKLIGVSCYNRMVLARTAAQQGADYVAFGAFFNSCVKPDAVQAELRLLRDGWHEMDLPIVAIGGITQQNGAALVEAGANALAVISALWNAPDIKNAAQGFSSLFSKA